MKIILVMISIVIPTYNEEKYLPNLLKSIKKQSYKDYEIIIADSSKDKTKKIARKFKCKIINGGYPTVARNNGAKKAKFDLLFLDADVILKDSNFLKNFLTKIKQNNSDIATCKILPDSGKFSHKIYYLIKNYTNRYHLKAHISGQCVFIKKKLFNKIKGYDESLLLGEEHDLVQRAIKNNVRFNFFMDLAVYNNPRRLEKGTLIILVKGAYSEFYRLFIAKIKKPIYKYDFGNH